MRVLITGISGYQGRRLAPLLLKRSHEVFGCGFRRSVDDLRAFWGEDVFDRIHYVEFDVADAVAVHRFFNQVHPEFVYHLAAQAVIPTSWTNPVSTYQTNVIGSYNVLDAALTAGVENILLASSSDVYGPVPADEQPITEDQPLRPRSPYGVSKAAMEGVGRIFWHLPDREMNIIVTRLFTTIGPGQPSDTAVSSFALQAARIKLGLQEPVLKCGNINNVRTWLSYNSLFELMLLLPEKVKRGKMYEDTVFNIGDTIEQSLRTIVRWLQEEVDFEIDDSSERNQDITYQVPETKKVQEATGWKPGGGIKFGVQRMYHYWLGVLA